MFIYFLILQSKDLTKYGVLFNTEYYFILSQILGEIKGRQNWGKK